MSRGDWVTCPGCNGRFDCADGDATRKKAKVGCPYCDVEFHQPKSAPTDGMVPRT